MSEADLTKIAEGLGLKDADELREMASHLVDDVTAMQASFASAGEAGIVPCPVCSANADWTRFGQQWTVECDSCKWSASGQLPASELARN